MMIIMIMMIMMMKMIVFFIYVFFLQSCLLLSILSSITILLMIFRRMYLDYIISSTCATASSRFDQWVECDGFQDDVIVTLFKVSTINTASPFAASNIFLMAWMTVPHTTFKLQTSQGSTPPS